MEPLTIHTGVAAPLDRANVDTDAIIPKQFLKKVDRSGFGKHLFHDWRYLDEEETKENPGFVLNQSQYRGATILLARDNFGCGSSREHAPWALADYGIKVIIAPSFADIFYNNCMRNGILLVRLKTHEVDQLFCFVSQTESAKITADLLKQKVQVSNDQAYVFEIDPFVKECLTKGLDSVGWTEQFKKDIDVFEKKLTQEKPWI